MAALLLLLPPLFVFPPETRDGKAISSSGSSVPRCPPNPLKFFWLVEPPQPPFLALFWREGNRIASSPSSAPSLLLNWFGFLEAREREGKSIWSSSFYYCCILEGNAMNSSSSSFTMGLAVFGRQARLKSLESSFLLLVFFWPPAPVLERNAIPPQSSSSSACV